MIIKSKGSCKASSRFPKGEKGSKTVVKYEKYSIYKEEYGLNKDRSGYIYLIKAGSTPPRYKIGRTKDIISRYERLKECCPFPLRMLASRKVKDMVKEEKKLHVEFDKYRVWGEWFELPLDLLEGLIKRYQEKEQLEVKPIPSPSELDELYDSLPF